MLLNKGSTFCIKSNGANIQHTVEIRQTAMDEIKIEQYVRSGIVALKLGQNRGKDDFSGASWILWYLGAIEI